MAALISVKRQLYARLALRMASRFRWPIWRNYWRYARTIDAVRRDGSPHLDYTPPNVVIWVTNRCNKDCEFCQYIDGLNAKNHRELELSFDRFRQLLDLPVVRNCFRLGLYGGEPLLNRELPQMIGYAKSRGHMVTVNTNGLLVKKRLAELLEARPDVLSISYYPEDAAKTEEAIALTAPHLPVIVKYMYSEARLGNIEEAADCAVRSGAWAIQFESYDSQGLVDDCELPAADGAVATVARANVELPVHQDDPRLSAIQRELEQRYGNRIWIMWPQRSDPRARASCRTFWHSAWLDARGQMLPCCVWPIEAFSGDVFAGSAGWNSARMLQLRKQMQQDVYPAICASCSHLRDDQLGI